MMNSTNHELLSILLGEDSESHSMRSLAELFGLRTVRQATTYGVAEEVLSYAMSGKLMAARDRIDPNAVMDMAVSTDTIGGSSGSPAVNARGEIIGANFDSTVLTQRNAYGYDRNTNRSVIVTTQAVTVALRDVYGMDHLLAELGVSR